MCSYGHIHLSVHSTAIGVLHAWKIYLRGALHLLFTLLSHFAFASIAPQNLLTDLLAIGGERLIVLLVENIMWGLNYSLVISGALSIWLHRIDWVFNGATPNVNLALALAREGSVVESSRSQGTSGSISLLCTFLFLLFFLLGGLSNFNKISHWGLPCCIFLGKQTNSTCLIHVNG